VLVISGRIISPLHSEPYEFKLPDMLAAEGFEVAVHTQQPVVDPPALISSCILSERKPCSPAAASSWIGPGSVVISSVPCGAIGTTFFQHGL
jgi:hypothetical protein